MSLPDTATKPRSPLRTAFMSAFGQKIAKLTAMCSPRTLVAGTLNETSTFTERQKRERVAHIVGTKAALAFFRASFDSTLPYDRRMPGTTNDARQKRTMSLALGRVAAPTLVVHGTQDGDVPFAHGENAAAG